MDFWEKKTEVMKVEPKGIKMEGSRRMNEVMKIEIESTVGGGSLHDKYESNMEDSRLQPCLNAGNQDMEESSSDVPLTKLERYQDREMIVKKEKDQDKSMLKNEGNDDSSDDNNANINAININTNVNINNKCNDSHDNSNDNENDNNNRSKGGEEKDTQIQKLGRENKEMKEMINQMEGKLHQLKSVQNLETLSLQRELKVSSQRAYEAEAKNIEYKDRIRSIVRQERENKKKKKKKRGIAN
ncbi:Kid domain containing protein [Reticulomyxa filosa]|uniref:Kid domain containing protein n=1 Tax=Reticulomyxa filosa TaxID=46433 RepID=X6NV09_RETFI|nr:Kid domain containing protein [Reticulomyxa filosa]|eukprot:ETO30145.1 Kid domain containing protein [Reticulomyxa filosa]